MEKFVTIATFDRVHEAHILKSRLEAAEIPAFIHHENINTMLPGLSSGGVKLQVYLADGYRAMDLLYDED